MRNNSYYYEDKNFKYYARKTWNFLWKDDSIWSWLVSLALAFVIVKFIFFPALSFVLGTSMPLVVVESSSMYHEGSAFKSLTGLAVTSQDSFSSWWDSNSEWYESRGISYDQAENWNFKSGLDKGDIIVVIGVEKPKEGDVIIFEAGQKHPIIHRTVSSNSDSFQTKGDNNLDQLDVEKQITQNEIIGKAVIRIPKLGWIKLVFIEIINMFR